VQGFTYSYRNENFLAVPKEFVEEQEHHLSGFNDINLTILAKKLANIPKTLNVIICDY